MIERLRNVAIIAHVDHGKTTLVDKLLAASGTLDRKEIQNERVMDSTDQEKRTRNYDSGEKHGFELEGLPHKSRGHTRPCRFRW